MKTVYNLLYLLALGGAVLFLALNLMQLTWVMIAYWCGFLVCAAAVAALEKHAGQQ